ncbi:MAG: VTT domain-containing protein [Mycobacteriaceae bacterium]
MTTATLALGPEFIQPNFLLGHFGLAGLLLVVFAECGLLVGFFLPGDSLLFTAGLISAGGAVLGGTPIDAFAPLWVLLVTVPVAAVAGDQLGYLIGRKAGPTIFTRDDSRLFKRRYVVEAHEFFAKHGSKAIILARFVPIVRTFMPVTAGVAQMPYRTYLPFDVAGGVLWGAGVTTLGYFLGQIDFVAQHIEVILLLIVAVSVVPILAQVIRSRTAGRSAQRTAGPTSGPTA